MDDLLSHGIVQILVDHKQYFSKEIFTLSIDKSHMAKLQTVKRTKLLYILLSLVQCMCGDIYIHSINLYIEVII